MPLKTVEIATNIVLVVFATTAAVRCVTHSFTFLLATFGGEETNGEGGGKWDLRMAYIPHTMQAPQEFARGPLK